MGGSSSSYKLINGSSGNSSPEWLASPDMKLMPMKAEIFTHTRVLGKGKFGLVYLAKHQQSTKDFRHVAIKYISKQTIFDFQNKTKMIQEIYALQTADHPFIIHCFGGFQTDTCLALVMEYAYGGELYNYMKKRHRMSDNEAKFYFCEIASALHYLHDELGIVYRDLKPENVMLDLEGHVRLCDFGFATQIAVGQEAEKLQDGCGTVMYMAPELVGKSQRNTHGFPVDWWALGCVLAEMIAGEAPFGNSESMNKFEIFNKISESPPSLPLLMGVSVKSLIKGLLNKSENLRYTYDIIVQSSWLKKFPWDELERRRIKPPFIPTISEEPTSENFIAWDDIALPTAIPNSKVMAYCKDISLPPIKVSNNSYGMRKSTGGTAGAAATTGGGGPMNRQKSVGKMNRQGSKKIQPLSDSQGEGDPEGSRPGPLGRQKSKANTYAPSDGSPQQPSNKKMTREKSKLEMAENSVKLAHGGAGRSGPHQPAASGRKGAGAGEGMGKKQGSKLDLAADSVKLTRTVQDKQSADAAQKGLGGKVGDSVKLTKQRSDAKMANAATAGTPKGAGAVSSTRSKSIPE